MITFLGIIVFIFGAIIGSFLNVVILRYKTGRTVGGRSFCFSCGVTLTALELVPLLSFVFSGGKCKSCRSPISWQYPAVELLTGIVFLIVFFKIAFLSSTVYFIYPLASIIFFWFAFSILIVISVYDLKHKIVPDLAVFTLACVSIVWMVISHRAEYFGTIPGVFDLLSGVILFLPFFLLWYFSDGAWMGLGDGKLAMAFGWMLGFVQGISAVVLGFWIAGAYAVLTMIIESFSKKERKMTRKTELPFAPFLVLGALIVFCFNLDVLSLRVFFGI